MGNRIVLMLAIEHFNHISIDIIRVLPNICFRMLAVRHFDHVPIDIIHVLSNMCFGITW